MAKAILGIKIGMTSYFTETGEMVPLTAIQAGPCPVVQVKTVERDKYKSAQIGFSPSIKAKGYSKAEIEHCAKSKLSSEIKVASKKGKEKTVSAGKPMPVFRYLREVKLDPNEEVKEGEIWTAGIYQSGDVVDIIGTSKGKGFAGGMKRHGWKGGRDTHGSMFHRRPGSIGASSYPSRVFKGKNLPGHMGDERVTIQNLKVFKVDEEAGIIFIKGAVPGAENGLLYIKPAVKKGKRV